MTGRRGSRRAKALLIAVAAAVLALLATAAAEGTLTYYRTPSQLVSSPTGSSSVRLGGTVVAGSIHRREGVVRFELTDGQDTVPVVAYAVPPSTFRAGQGAVVQGRMESDGTFRATSVIVRHDNVYKAIGAP